TDRILSYLHKQVIKKRDSSAESYIISAIEDAYKRLIEPSIEREIRKELSEKAEERAIHIFSENLRKLLLQPPLKGKVVLG
ncbi:RNA-binding transcriptional accessory protein, partial [Escherichia coli]|nr:RNA-binding transcriptional accessory protein [Escherichia coli]